MSQLIFASRLIFLLLLMSSAFTSLASSDPCENTTGAGFVIFRRIDPEIEYLMIKSSHGKELWSSPKGHINPGENDFTAALRELKEETNFTENDLNIYMDIQKIICYTVQGYHKTVVYWLAEPKDPEKDPTLSEEHTEFRWVTKDDAIALVQEYAEFDELINYFEQKIETLALTESQE